MLQEKKKSFGHPTKPSSNDDSGFRHVFRVKATLPLTQSISVVSYNTTRLHCHIMKITDQIPGSSYRSFLQ